eukprot:SAG31_NODE_2015_length_6664_cov_32.172734_3_plen_250_part_00
MGLLEDIVFCAPTLPAQLGAVLLHCLLWLVIGDWERGGMSAIYAMAKNWSSYKTVFAENYKGDPSLEMYGLESEPGKLWPLNFYTMMHHGTGGALMLAGEDEIHLHDVHAFMTCDCDNDCDNENWRVLTEHLTHCIHRHLDRSTMAFSTRHARRSRGHGLAGLSENDLLQDLSARALPYTQLFSRTKACLAFSCIPPHGRLDRWTASESLFQRSAGFPSVWFNHSGISSHLCCGRPMQPFCASKVCNGA